MLSEEYERDTGQKPDKLDEKCKVVVVERIHIYIIHGENEFLE